MANTGQFSKKINTKKWPKKHKNDPSLQNFSKTIPMQGCCPFNVTTKSGFKEPGESF